MFSLINVFTRTFNFNNSIKIVFSIRNSVSWTVFLIEKTCTLLSFSKLSLMKSFLRRNFMEVQINSSGFRPVCTARQLFKKVLLAYSSTSDGETATPPAITSSKARFILRSSATYGKIDVNYLYLSHSHQYNKFFQID